MNEGNLDSIFEQIDSLTKPRSDSREKNSNTSNEQLSEIMNFLSSEIQRVLDENGFTQEDLCKRTNMSQSNISKILNGKVVPTIETLQKIASATHTRLVVGFESFEGDE